MQIKQTDPRIKRLGQLLTGAVEAIQEAGKILVELIAEDEDAFEKIKKALPHVTEKSLIRIRKVGLGLLDPRIMIDGSHAARRLESLPIERQKFYWENPIPVVVSTLGRPEIVQKNARELTYKEVSTVFSKDGIRNPTEQISVLRERREIKPEKIKRYEIMGDYIFFYEKSKFTRAELEEIIEKMPKLSAQDLERKMREAQIAAKKREHVHANTRLFGAR